VPDHRIPAVGARIMDLQDPTVKMSTSTAGEQGTVHVLDDPATIEKKIRSAVTDSGDQVRRAPDKQGIANLIEILAAVRASAPEAIEQEFAEARYGDFKAAVAEEVVAYLAPTRERYEQLRGDEQALERTLAQGAERAREIAAQTLADVRERMGIGPPRRGRQLP
jgi:tryptophanyl-tRNA synthetase